MEVSGEKLRFEFSMFDLLSFLRGFCILRRGMKGEFGEDGQSMAGLYTK